MRELPGGQQGDMWHEHRLGRITASRMNDLTAYSKAKGKEGVELQKRIDYRFELLAERLTRRLQKHYVTPAMEYGIEAEDEAKQAFQLATGKMLMPVGFVLHPVFNFAGCTPDSVLEDAVYETKNPESTTYLEWFFGEGCPEEHVKQIQWQIACTKKSHGIFHARDARQPEKIRNIIRYIDRDSELIAKLEAEAVKMDAEIEALIAKAGLPPTEWVIEGGELALPSKYDPETKFNRQCRESLEALEVLDDDWEQIIEKRVQRVEEGVA